jgi:hypothetical protein
VTAAPRHHSADNILHSLHALGARVECRGDKVILRVGAQPVPGDLIAAARLSKNELAKLIDTNGVEHLGRPTEKNSRFSAASIEGAQLQEEEHLREELSIVRDEASFVTSADHSAKVLTQDAQLSTFQTAQDSCGVEHPSTSKVLNLLHVDTLPQNECPHPVWREGEKGAEAKPRIATHNLPDKALQLQDGRHLWRFSCRYGCPPEQAATLIDEAHSYGVVLVADGHELIVVEPQFSRLPSQALSELARYAESVINQLLLQSRNRCEPNIWSRDEG